MGGRCSLIEEVYVDNLILQDNGDPEKTAEVIIQVDVTDVQDTAPIFQPSTRRFYTVEENSDIVRISTYFTTSTDTAENVVFCQKFGSSCCPKFLVLRKRVCISKWLSVETLLCKVRFQKYNCIHFLCQEYTHFVLPVVI